MQVIWYMIIGVLFGIIYVKISLKNGTKHDQKYLAGGFCLAIIIWPAIIIACIIAIAIAVQDQLKERRSKSNQALNEEDWDE